MSKILVVDVETGGLDPTAHSILALGAVIWEDGVLIDSFEAFINESELFVDAEAMAINRIDLNWHRMHGEPPIAAMKRFLDFLETHFSYSSSGMKIPLAGHNVAFDAGFLRRLSRLCNVSYDRIFSHRLLDTAGIVRFLILAGKLPLADASSTEAFEHFGISPSPQERHTALGDARATAILLSRLIELVR